MVAITARLILNGSLLKEVIIPDTMGEFYVEARTETPEMRPRGFVYPLKFETVCFKRSYYNDTVFIANVSKRLEDLLRVKIEAAR